MSKLDFHVHRCGRIICQIHSQSLFGGSTGGALFRGCRPPLCKLYTGLPPFHTSNRVDTRFPIESQYAERSCALPLHCSSILELARDIS